MDRDRADVTDADLVKVKEIWLRAHKRMGPQPDKRTRYRFDLSTKCLCHFEPTLWSCKIGVQRDLAAATFQAHKRAMAEERKRQTRWKDVQKPGHHGLRHVISVKRQRDHYRRQLPLSRHGPSGVLSQDRRRRRSKMSRKTFMIVAKFATFDSRKSSRGRRLVGMTAKVEPLRRARMRSSIAHIPDVEVTFNSENKVRRIRNSPSNVGHSPIIVLMQRRHPHDSTLR